VNGREDDRDCRFGRRARRHDRASRPFVAGRLDLDRTKLWMLVATVAWFLATPVWMKQA
jgi:hypothetical protein